MKKILVSWCGITDMKAALGFEKSSAIMSALSHNSYDELYVLLYTDKRKNPPVELSTADDIAACVLRMADWVETHKSLLQQLSNTPQLNYYYKKVIEDFCASNGLPTKVHTENIFLEDLNDVENIYSAAINLLNCIVSGEEERAITLNISSGTPAMAFVWAFAALRYPQENVELLSSSRSEQAPEKVPLPAEWRCWHARRIFNAVPTKQKWDVVYHLFGEQRIPALVGITKLQAHKHVFITSLQYPGECMKPYIGDADFEELRIDAHDWDNIRDAINGHINKLSPHAEIAFNLTGGTKIMYAGALEIANQTHAPAFYFDFRNKLILNLQDNSRHKLDYSFSLPTLISLHCNVPLCNMAQSGIWQADQERANLLLHIYKNRASIRQWEQDVRKAYFGKRLEQELMNMTSFSDLKTDEVSVSLSENGSCQIQCQDKIFYLQYFPGIVKYLFGGWFEEFFYITCILPLIQEQVIKEARINLELCSAANPDEVYQELDVAFTNGKQLFIVECKSGKVLGEHISKLSAIVRNYGGMGGRGILCYTDPIYSATIKSKAEEMGILLLRIYPFSNKKFQGKGWDKAISELREFIKAQ